MHQNEDEGRHLGNAEGTSDTQGKREETKKRDYPTADQCEITASALNGHKP